MAICNVVKGDLKRESDLVRAEYMEMPGLCLTGPQIRRLWSFAPAMCEAVLAELVSARFLRRTPDGEYVLSGGVRDTGEPSSSRVGDISSDAHDML
jgi:hypothetical protein